MEAIQTDIHNAYWAGVEAGERKPRRVWWQTTTPPVDVVLLAEVPLGDGSTECWACFVNDDGDLCDYETGDAIGWDHSDVSRWYAFDGVERVTDEESPYYDF